MSTTGRGQGDWTQYLSAGHQKTFYTLTPGRLLTFDPAQCVGPKKKTKDKFMQLKLLLSGERSHFPIMISSETRRQDSCIQWIIPQLQVRRSDHIDWDRILCSAARWHAQLTHQSHYQSAIKCWPSCIRVSCFPINSWMHKHWVIELELKRDGLWALRLS